MRACTFLKYTRCNDTVQPQKQSIHIHYFVGLHDVEFNTKHVYIQVVISVITTLNVYNFIYNCEYLLGCTLFLYVCASLIYQRILCK